MKLNELLTNIPYRLVQGTDDLEVSNLSWDSRSVAPNSLFICVKNRNVDRHLYGHEAARKGAAALIIEHEIGPVDKNITVIQVENSRKSMAIIANTFYGEPSKKFNLIGITGTNGKTSTSYFIAKILETAGRRAGVIGTIQNTIGDKVLRTEKINPTTPDAIELQASFAEMVSEGVTDVVIEATSSALSQHRVDGCDFDIGVFTNLTQDHLEEHGTMENYKQAKMRLFQMCKYGVINTDDPVSEEILQKGSCSIITYGIEKPADFQAQDILHSIDGTTFMLHYHGIERFICLKVPGLFSVYNALAAVAACYQSGLTMNQIVEGLSNIEGVRGRFETIPNPKGCLVVVDYAHSPDGLENILSSVRQLTQKKLITVFGCGGDRDRTKRPIMGEIAGRLSDTCIITSDNPRTENPTGILNDIEAGIKDTACPYAKIENRKEAIYAALESAEQGDAIVIAGKGHENYQIIGQETIHFDDMEVVKEFFEAAVV